MVLVDNMLFYYIYNAGLGDFYIICTKRTFVVDHINKFNYIRDTGKYNL